jgi:hypothetical protein
VAKKKREDVVGEIEDNESEYFAEKYVKRAC